VDYPQFLENIYIFIKKKGKSTLNSKETKPLIDFKVKWLLLITRIHVDLMGICSSMKVIKTKEIPKDVNQPCQMHAQFQVQKRQHKMCKM
jgi:hypothetical protein